MNRKNLITYVSCILIGFVGGRISGYTLASGGGAMRGENHADVTATNHQTESSPAQNGFDVGSTGDRFDNITIPSVPFDEGCDINTFISWFQCRSSELNQESGGLHIAVGHPLVHDPEFSTIRFKYKARNLSARQVLDAFSKQTGISYSIRPCAVLSERREPKKEAE
jgi:hypothetical protein